MSQNANEDDDAGITSDALIAAINANDKPLVLAIIRRSEAYLQHAAFAGDGSAITALHWSPSTHHFHDCTPTSAKGFTTVMHVAARLMLNESLRQESGASRQTRSSARLACHLPIEIWHHILSFLRRTDLEIDETARTMIEDAPICEVFSTAPAEDVGSLYDWWHRKYRTWQGRSDYWEDGGRATYTNEEPIASCPLYIAMLKSHEDHVEGPRSGYGTDTDIAKMLMTTPSASTEHAKLIINQAAVGSADADGVEYVRNFDPCGFGDYYGGVLSKETDNSTMTELLIKDLPGDPIVKKVSTYGSHFERSKMNQQSAVRQEVFDARELAKEFEGIYLTYAQEDGGY